MAIHEPGKRLMHHVGLQFVEKAVTGGGGRSTNASLSLTSMIDFLVVTVVFLLMSFSASGDTMVYKGVTLPAAQNTEDMLEAPIVAITGTDILVDGVTAGNTRNVQDFEGPPRKIEELFQRLDSKKKTWTQINSGKKFPGIVILQIDEKIQAKVVKSVFQTCGFAGYANINFMVNSMGGAAPPAGP